MTATPPLPARGRNPGAIPSAHPDATHLARLRWAVRAALTLGVTASVAANVLHARPNLISQIIAAWPPLALLLTVELISRVPAHRRGLATARLLAAAVIAGIAAWVSYFHMAGVAARYGETDAAASYLLPISVDGLVVVASISLVEIAGRIRTSGTSPVADLQLPATPVQSPPSSDEQPAANPPETRSGPVVAPQAIAGSPPASIGQPSTTATAAVHATGVHRPVTGSAASARGGAEPTGAGQPAPSAADRDRQPQQRTATDDDSRPGASTVDDMPPATDSCQPVNAGAQLRGGQPPRPASAPRRADDAPGTDADVPPRWSASSTMDSYPFPPAAQYGDVQGHAPPTLDAGDGDSDGREGSGDADDRDACAAAVPSDTAAAVAYWYRRDPSLHPADIAARIGRSERTVRRYWPPAPQRTTNGHDASRLAKRLRGS